MWLLHLLVQGHEGSLLCYGVFTAEEIGVVDSGSEHTQQLKYRHSWGGLFRHVPEISLH